MELNLGLHQDDRLLGVTAAVALDDLGQHEVHELLQHERHADRGDEEGQRPGVAPSQRPVGHRLQSDRGASGDRHREQHGDSEVEQCEPHPAVVGVTAGGESEDDVQAEVRAEHAEHENLGVREVDQPQHTEHQGVADGDQGVDRPPGQSVDGELPEPVSQVLDVEADVPGEAGVLADTLVDHLLSILTRTRPGPTKSGAPDASRGSSY